MTESIGLDIVENARIEHLYAKQADRFVDRILGPEEQELFHSRKDKIQFLAGRFAAKEALIKALGVWIVERPPYRSLQIIHDSSGRPQVHLEESVRGMLGNRRILVSLSHEKSYSVGMVVITEGP